MNRNIEWDQLIEENNHEPIPDTLETSIDKGIQKYQHKMRQKHFIFYPLTTFCAVFAAFVISVNLFPAFAQACSKIPVLRDLAKAVSFSPSLSAAVENEYVQTMDLSQTQDGITMRVEYVIVDPSQLNIFYTLSSDKYHAMDGAPCVFSATDHTYLPACILSGHTNEEGEGLRHITVDFNDTPMPNQLIFTLGVHDNGSYEKTEIIEESVNTALGSEESSTAPIPITTFSFTLEFDPYYTAQEEIISLKQDFTMEDQKLTLEQVRIYPTYLCIDLSSDPDNTQWLRSLTYCVKDEHGKKYSTIANGVTGVGAGNGSPEFVSFRVDSSFFSDAKHLNLYITEAAWMDKTDNLVTLNLNKQTCSPLPDGVTLAYCEKAEDNYHIAFRVDTDSSSKDDISFRDVFTNEYYAPDGTQHCFQDWSCTTRGTIFDNTFSDDETCFYINYTLHDYSYDTVSLQLSNTGTTTLADPIQITIK